MALTEEDKKFIDRSNKDSIKEFFQGFWELNLEPVLNDIYGELKRLNGKVNDLDGKVNDLDGKVNNIDSKVSDLDSKVEDLTLEVKANSRKLDSEISYRDRLEKRVKVLEKAH